MDAADDSRKLWASLIRQTGPFYGLALGSWLGAAAAAVGDEGAGAASSAGSSDEGDLRVGMGPAFLAGVPFAPWGTALAPVMKAWTQAFDALQATAWNGFNPKMENPMARLLGHPAAVVGGDGGTGRQTMLAVMAMGDFVKSMAAHQGMQAQGWAKAFARFFTEFQLATEGDTPEVTVSNLDDLMTHWSTVGEAALQEHSRTDRFLASQAEVLRKSMQFQVARRRVIEAALRANDLPTLTDMDEAFAAIHEMRGELRILRRQVAAKDVSRPATPEPAAIVKPKAGARSMQRAMQ